jgi:hypothetical protein
VAARVPRGEEGRVGEAMGETFLFSPSGNAEGGHTERGRTHGRPAKQWTKFFS